MPKCFMNNNVAVGVRIAGTSRGNSEVENRSDNAWSIRVQRILYVYSNLCLFVWWLLASSILNLPDELEYECIYVLEYFFIKL